MDDSRDEKDTGLNRKSSIRFLSINHYWGRGISLPT